MIWLLDMLVVCSRQPFPPPDHQIFTTKIFCNDIAILLPSGVTILTILCLIAMSNNAVNLCKKVDFYLKETE
jgi:hypothetical protein